MLNVELDEINGIAILSPNGALSEKDFESASSVIDSYIEKYGNLKGLIINTKTFPGWESFGSLIKHFKFVKEHHKKVSHVALVTDSVLGDFGEKIADHFVSAEIKHFAFDDLNKAQSWILNTEPK
ncbi:MAG: STAS/SEC14 domain-containing protein [Gammaproteobacteria bacterium]